MIAITKNKYKLIISNIKVNCLIKIKWWITYIINLRS